MGLQFLVNFFNAHKTHVTLELLATHGAEFQGFHEIVAQEMIELALNLSTLFLRAFREGVPQIFSNHTFAIANDVIENQEEEIRNEIENGKGHCVSGFSKSVFYKIRLFILPTTFQDSDGLFLCGVGSATCSFLNRRWQPCRWSDAPPRSVRVGQRWRKGCNRQTYNFRDAR